MTYISIMGIRKDAFFSILSMLARDCTNNIGNIKKKVRKKNETATISLLKVSLKNGIERFCQ